MYFHRVFSILVDNPAETGNLMITTAEFTISAINDTITEGRI